MQQKAIELLKKQRNMYKTQLNYLPRTVPVTSPLYKELKAQILDYIKTYDYIIDIINRC